MQDARRGTGVAYNTVFRAKNGERVREATARALRAWSIKLTRGRHWISAALAMGLDESEALTDELLHGVERAEAKTGTAG